MKMLYKSKYAKTAVLIFLLSLAVLGCRKNEKPQVSLQDRKNESAADAETEEKADSKKTSGESISMDITSRKAIDDFLEGEWRLIDTVGEEEYATLMIYDDGRCEYDRDADDFLVEGDFSVKRHQTFDEKTDELIDDEQYTGFDLSFYDIPKDFNSPDQDYYSVNEESVDGNFHIARGDGYDYLYLEWIGNGDSYIFGFMFQNPDRIKKEYDESGEYRPQNDMVFRRANKGISDAGSAVNDRFFGLIWANMDGNLWIQAMDAHTCDSEDEYTGRKYKKAYFTEQNDIGIRKYRLKDDADTSLVFNTKTLNGEYPVMMCYAAIDENGEVSSLRELDRAIYGAYDFGNIEQEYSFDGSVFTVNGADFDIKDLGSEANRITDIKQVGDRIVVRADIPPHHREYYIVNIYSGNIEKIINGENLTWVDDDITTAVYSSGDSVYNFKDNVIGITDGAEVRDLKLKSGGKTVVARDENDGVFSFEPDEEEEEDEAMYRYADFYLKRTVDSWREFMDCAPDDAIAYVVVSPPDVIKDKLPWLQTIDEGCYDSLYVAALRDDTTIHVDSVSYDADRNGFDAQEMIDRAKLQKGESKGYEIVVPEGIPCRCLYVSSGDESGYFPIATISGKSSRNGMFITSSMEEKDSGF